MLALLGYLEPKELCPTWRCASGPFSAFKRARDLLEEFRGTRELLSVHNTTRLAQKWEPPVGLSYKVNFDAALFADADASGDRRTQDFKLGGRR